MIDCQEFKGFYVILVEPKYSGNIGAVARSMMNFDFSNLSLVNPCEFTDECYARAMHARQILENATIYSSFTDAVKSLDYIVATSSVDTVSEKKHLRNPILLEEFSRKIFEVKGQIGLIFGREDYGLYNEEIAECDIMLKIPTSETYPSLNLSHAVNLVLYTLYINRIFTPKERRNLGNIEKQKINEFFSDILEEIQYPQHKKKNTEIMFKRIMGRAMLSKWEYHTLMGVYHRALEQLKKSKKK